MRLYKRGKVYWIAWTEGGVTVRRSTQCTDKEAATLALRKRQRELADPTHAAASQATVESAAVLFLRSIRKTKLADGTLNMYECKAGHVVRLLGRKRLSELEHAHVFAYTEKREAETASKSTVDRELTTLRRILKHAAKLKMFNRDVDSVMPEYSSDYVPRKRWLRPEDIDAVLSHIEPGRGAALAYALAFAFAVDRSAVFRAERNDVGKSQAYIRGTKNTNRARPVPRLSIFEKYVRFALDYADGEGALLFRKWSMGSDRRDIARACKRAGVEPFTWIDLRRTAASWLVQAGVPYEVAAKFMGHGSTIMLQKVYGQLSTEDVGRLIEERLSIVRPVYQAKGNGDGGADVVHKKPAKTRGTMLNGLQVKRIKSPQLYRLSYQPIGYETSSRTGIVRLAYQDRTPLLPEFFGEGKRRDPQSSRVWEGPVRS